MAQKLVSTAQFTVVDANDGISASLTNEAITLQADAGGNVSSFAGASSIMTVRIGQYDDSTNWAYCVSALGAGISYYSTGDVVPRLGFGTVDGVLTGGAIQVAAMSADSSYIDITASKVGFASLTKRINVAKARNGTSARTVKLSASPALAFLTPSGSTTPAPAKVTLTASVQGLASPTYAWQIDGVAQPGANTSSFDVSAFAAGSTKTVKVIATDASGSVEDIATIASIKNGDTGATGAAGENFVINLATTELWDAAVNTDGAAKYGGAFVMNGDGNQRVWGVDPFGRPALIWKTIGNDAAQDGDGGWNKTVPVVDSKSYMSVVYVRRASASTVGQYYHGCAPCLYPNGGAAETNPYFQSCPISYFDQNEWYVSIGFIHANGQATPATGKGGLYKLSNGSQTVAGSDYRMAAGQVSQSHRTYMYYSTDPTASLEWWGAGFYEINGNEPSMQTLIGNPNWQNSALIPTINTAKTDAISAAAADASTKANAAATTAVWTGVTGTGKPADNANNTYVDTSGNIQGTSSGSGMSVANNVDGIIRMPGGGTFRTTDAGQTGRIKIKLPQSWSRTMVKFSVDIYEYVAGYSCSLDIAGYNYDGGFWTEVTARVIGGSNVEYPVYFGHDGATCCVWIGATPAETWSYPQVSVRDVMVGFSNFTRTQWESGWSVSLDTTAIVPGTGANAYSAHVQDTLPGADWAKTSGAGKPADNATRNVNRGAWAPGVIYVIGDIVTKDGSSWSCVAGNTSSVSVTPPTLPVTISTYWSLLSSAGSNGSTGYTLNFTGSCGYALGSQSAILKTVNTGAWDAQAYSTESYARGCYVSAQASTDNVYAMFGLNSDPTANASYETIDYAWFIADSSNILVAYENGAHVGTFGNYTTSTLLSITYDGQNVRYLKDGVVVRTVARPIGAPLFFDSSYVLAGGITNLQFGPMGEAGVRGSVKRYAAGAAWSDAVALTAVGGSAVAGDEVTITDGSTFVMTKYYSAGAWTAPGTVIDGNLIVTQSIKGASLDALAIRGKTLSAGVYMDAGSTTTAAVTAPAVGATATVSVVDTTDFPTTGTALVLGTSSTVMGSIRYTGKNQTALLSSDWVGFNIPSGAIIVPMPTSGGLLYSGSAGATSVQIQSEFCLFRKAGGSAMIVPVSGSSLKAEVFTYTGATISGTYTQTLTGVSGITQSGLVGNCVVLDLTPNIPTATLATGSISTITIDGGSLESFADAGGSFYLMRAGSTDLSLPNIKGYASKSGNVVTLTAPLTIATAGVHYLIPSFTNTVIGSSVASVVTISEATCTGVVSSVIGDSRGQSRFGSNINPPPSNSMYAAPLKVQTHAGEAITVLSTSAQSGPLMRLIGGGIALESVMPTQASITLDAAKIAERGFASYSAPGESFIPLQASLISKQAAWITPQASTGYAAFGVVPTMLGSTVALAAQNSTTEYNKRKRTSCAGTYLTNAGFFVPYANYFQGSASATVGGFFTSFSYKINDAAGTGGRLFAGMQTAVTAIGGTTNPATLVNCFGVGMIAADTTQLYIVYGGTVAQTPIPTGVSPTIPCRVSIYSQRTNSNSVSISIDDISVPGAATTLYSGVLVNDGAGTTMPLLTAALAPTLWRGSSGANIGIDILGFYAESDS